MRGSYSGDDAVVRNVDDTWLRRVSNGALPLAELAALNPREGCQEHHSHEGLLEEGRLSESKAPYQRIRRAGVVGEKRSAKSCKIKWPESWAPEHYGEERIQANSRVCLSMLYGAIL